MVGICEDCGEKYKKIRKKQKFCSVSCVRNNKRIKQVRTNCKYCGNEFLKKRNRQKFCSKICARRNNISNADSQKAGLLSAQKRVKRSKNEIYFAELCKLKYKNIETNKIIFNGWDADIIIHDLKIAILWNGKWHYEKITEKHSLKQVQNRDKIKINEIINCGYKPYIIKDMGSHNKRFVNEKFNEFISRGGSSW